MDSIPLDDIKIGKRFRKDVGDLDDLVQSMDSMGLFHPVVLDESNTLIAGFRRVHAAKKLAWTSIPFVIVKNITDAISRLNAERDENTCRKDFTVLESVELGRAIEELERPKARQRMADGRSIGGQTAGKHRPKDNLSSLVKEERAEPPDRHGIINIVAPAVGMRPSSYGRAKAVVKAAEEDPETFGPIAEEMNMTGKVTPAYNRIKEIQQSKEPQPSIQVKESPAETQHSSNGSPAPIERRGVGVIKANEAIDCLARIPKDDVLRKRGFQIVMDWIKSNQ